MNAVITKPRGKAAKRPAVVVKTEPPLVTIADIRQWIGTAEAKLELAYDAAEPGEPIDMLLDHINHDVILEPNRIIQRDDLTQVDAKRVYEKLFPVLACIQGAVKLAESTVLHSTLEEAFALLDTAQTALDPVNDAVRSLPAGGEEHDFARGRDLAVNMLTECRNAPEASECHRRNRAPGARQHNIVDNYVTELLCETSLLEGFTSVLSGALGPQVLEPEYFADLSLSETQAGEPGADGTQGEESESPPVISQKLDFEATGIEKNAYCMVSEVIEIIRCREQDIGKDLVYGARYAVEHAYRILGDGVQARSMDECEDASGPLAAAIAVLEMVLQAVDDVALHGALRLLDMAKQSLDDAIADGDLREAAVHQERHT